MKLPHYQLLNRIDKEIEEIQADTERRMGLLQQRKWALEEALRAYREMMGSQISMTLESLSEADIENRSQRDILCLIAQRNGGLLIAKNAIKLMKVAGIFGNPDHADSVVYSILNRSQEFIKVGKGVYRLNGGKQTSVSNRLLEKRLSGLTQAIRVLKEKNPEMTKKQVRDTLIKHDFDFQGRKPGQAVHMAWVNLGYAAKEALQKDVHRLALLGIKKERNEKEGVVYMKCPCCDKYRGTPKDVANHIKGVFDEIHTEWLETHGFDPVELVRTGNWLQIIEHLDKIAKSSI